MQPTAETPPNERKVFPLRAVTGRLKTILLDATKKQIWVRAQFVADRSGRQAGHCYGEFVESDEQGQPVARMRVVIWQREHERIKQKLKETGQPESLSANKEICALCSVRFHEVYGLQLQVFDVDPYFGEAQIEGNRRRILEELQAEGLLGKNKTHSIRADLL